MDTQAPGQDTAAPEWIANTFDAETAAIAVKDPEVIKYKTPGEFYKGYKGKTELLGRKGVIIPKDGDAPEIMQKYRETMGIPEKPDGYKFKTPEKLHPSIKVSPEFEATFKAKMHAKGISNAQADALFNDLLTDTSNQMTQRDAANEKARLDGLTKLNQKWGKDTESNIALARRAAEKVLGGEGFKGLGDFANNPAAVELLVGMSKMLSEDSIRSIGGVEQAGSMEADKQIKQIMGLSKEERAKHPYWDENHPNHHAEVKRVRDLYTKREVRNAS